jgi:uncharacterized membrane protein HdeD (DUF308 family)
MEQLEHAGRLWWMALLLSVVSIAVGILALAYPGPTLTTIAIIFSIVLLARGIVMCALAFVVRAVTHDAGGERSRPATGATGSS